jgi:methylphosphotriester-DNA--protein-cysteine methyltransferase
MGLSQSALERRFRGIVGISPKKFASVVRLRRRSATADERCGLHCGGAYDAGYFDQAHFIHDFRRATGSAPETFFRQVPAE